jgi:RNA polymerase sigma-70 factor (ECF subfamily)
MAITQKLLRGGPGRSAVHREVAAQVRSALGKLCEKDQEILLLRHSEGLTNAEAAVVLDIDPRAASKRYGRAVARLSKELGSGGYSPF